MNWHVVRWQEAAPTPWRNGGGVTRELAAWPAHGDWHWRMSVAEITADGPFSRFDGVRRWFAVLDGPGVVIRIGDRVHRLEASSPPLAFDGTDDVHCALDGGPTRDFNLMVRLGVGCMERVHGEVVRLLGRDTVVGLWTGEAGGEIVQAEARLAVPPHSLAWCVVESEESIQARTIGGLWLEVHP